MAVANAADDTYLPGFMAKRKARRMSARSVPLIGIMCEVSNGPDRDRLFDSMKYARDSDVSIPVTFTVVGIYEGDIIGGDFDVIIDKLQHCNHDGSAFMIDASLTNGSGVNLKIANYNTHLGKGTDAEFFE